MVWWAGPIRNPIIGQILKTLYNPLPTEGEVVEVNPGDALLLENGDYLLLENGDRLLLEDGT